MATALELFKQNLQLPAAFQGMQADEDLGAGIGISYAVVGYRGKVWSIKYKGEEQHLMAMLNGQQIPLPSIEAVLLKAPNHTSKVWYESGWQDGSNAPPDCASSNGITPDPGVPKPQSPTCAACKWDQFGSRPPQPGQPPSKGKACPDNKRVAIVPLADVKNEAYGGPMLLRVPAMSLQDLALFASQMKQLNIPYYAVGVRISFDMSESFPKFIITPIRVVTDAEAKIILEHRASMEVQRIIDGNASSEAVPAAAQTVPPVATQPQQVQQVQQPVQQPQPQPTPQPQPQPAQPQAPTSAFGGVVVGAAAPATPAPSTPQQTTAAFGGFGGGQPNGQGGPTATQPARQQVEPESSGVPAFDQSLDAELDALLAGKG